MKNYPRSLPILIAFLTSLLIISGASGAQQGGGARPGTTGQLVSVPVSPGTKTLLQPAYRAPVTLTQSNDLTIEGAVECGSGEIPGLSWWRAFDLEAEGVLTELLVQSVDTAVTLVQPTADLGINVYTSTQNPPVLASLTLLGSGQITLRAGSVTNALVNVPVTAIVPAGSIMVIEAVVPPDDPLGIGFNTNGQTAPTYFSKCVASEITDVATLVPNSGWVMQVNGDDGQTVETALVENGDFEAEILDTWVLKNESGDKVKCNTETKVVANTGLCAFQFKGVVGESSKIQQTIDLAGVTFMATDTLSLSLFANAKRATASGKVKVVVKYSDSTDRTKLTADIATTVGYAELIDSDVLLSAAVSKIKLQISHKSTSGKIFVDDVSLAQIAGVPALLPLP